jgi:hypothetical protein
MNSREELINFIRNEYDPKPDLGRGDYPAFDWDDGAGRIADAILADQLILLRKHAEEIEKLTSGVAQRPLPPLIDRSELIALLQDLASVNLSREACERQAMRMADDLIARGLTLAVTSTERAIPNHLDRALRTFNAMMEKWLEDGGDKRLREFSPLLGWKAVVNILMSSTERLCTCHPSEAPVPCQKKYAYSECIKAAFASFTTEPEKCPTCRLTDKEISDNSLDGRCPDPWHGDDHLRAKACSVTSTDHREDK